MAHKSLSNNLSDSAARTSSVYVRCMTTSPFR